MAGLDFGFPLCHWTGEGDPLDRSVGVAYATIDDTNIPAGVSNAGPKWSAPFNASFQAFCSGAPLLCCRLCTAPSLHPSAACKLLTKTACSLAMLGALHSACPRRAGS